MERHVEKYFEENKPYAGLARASLHSGIILVASRILNVFMQVVSAVLLARLLSPRDFGLVAMVLALVGFGPMLVDFGTTEASTQKTRITPLEVSALFWFNVSIGGILTLLLLASSGLIALFYSEPALSGIALVLAPTFIMAAVSTQHSALMRRAMQFRRLATIDIFANLISSVIGITMAFTEWGYWALVAKPVLATGLNTVGLWICCPWLPTRPRFTPEVKRMVGFGMSVTAFSMTDFVTQSADRVALGYFYGAGPLGYFQNAFLIYTNLLSLVANPFHNIAVSGLSKLKDSMEDLRRSWAAALSPVSFFSAAAFAALAVTGQDFVVILLGQKWAPAGTLLCIFAFRGIAQGVERTLGWLHVAVGRPERWMRWGFFSAACQLVALIAGLPFGPIGVATAYAIAMFVLFVPALAYAGHPVCIASKDVLAVVGPQVIAAIISVAFGLAFQQVFLVDFSRLARFSVSVPICLATYLAVVVGVFRVTGPLQLALSVLRDFAPIRLLRSS